MEVAKFRVHLILEFTQVSRGKTNAGVVSKHFWRCHAQAVRQAVCVLKNSNGSIILP